MLQPTEPPGQGKNYRGMVKKVRLIKDSKQRCMLSLKPGFQYLILVLTLHVDRLEVTSRGHLSRFKLLAFAGGCMLRDGLLPLRPI